MEFVPRIVATPGPVGSRHLLTYFGTLVYLDEATSVLRHGPLGTVPNNVSMVDEGGVAGIFRPARDGGAAQPIGDLGPHRCGVLPDDPSPCNLRVTRTTGDTFCLGLAGRFLTAEADGSISLFRTLIGFWEMFLPISAGDYEELCFVAGNAWIRRAPQAILHPSDIVPDIDFAWRFGGAALALRDLLAVIRGPVAMRPSHSLELLATHQGWKVIHLRLYRPLIYLIGYGADDIFACASLAIGSLLCHGKWTGDVMFITDRAHAGFAPESAPAPEKFHVVTLPAFDTLDFALARYKIATIEAAKQFQPVIYLDTDVVCNAPLDSLLASLCFSDSLHAHIEGDLMTPDDHYGKTLFERDPGLAGGDDKGFSTGILAFRNVARFEHVFHLIVSGAYNFASEALRRDFFPAFDQPFANYVARCGLDRVGGLGLWAHVSLYIFEPDCSPASRHGLIHFAGGVGNATPKVDRMRSYLEAIGAPTNNDRH